MIRFTVLGKAEPAGSKKVVPNKKLGRSIVVDANKRSKPWKQSVAGVATAEMNGRPPLEGAIALSIKVLVQRPKSHYLTDGHSLSAAGRKFPAHTMAPDVLKLARGIEDALTGICYVDDGQIVMEVISKRWCEPNEREQVEIIVAGHDEAAPELIVNDAPGYVQ
jgi:crossover junction endodeoxyribonuclease RusA